MLEDSASDWDDDFASDSKGASQGDSLAMALRAAVGIVADEDDIEDWDDDFESVDHTTAESTSASLSKQGVFCVGIYPQLLQRKNCYPSLPFHLWGHESLTNSSEK